jgi:cytochrome c biogenesis factor
MTLFHWLFDPSFPVYVAGTIAGLVALAAVHAKSLAKALIRLRNSMIAGAVTAIILVIFVAMARHSALVQNAAAWGHRSPGELLAYGGGDTFVIVTLATFLYVAFRKQASGWGRKVSGWGRGSSTPAAPGRRGGARVRIGGRT